MREIKFRCWDKTRQRMSGVRGISWLTKEIILWIKEEKFILHISFNEGNLMQYTGLKDKNGKEIYEGDIVDGVYGRERYVIEFEDDTWNYSYALDEYMERPQDNWEVIGNIYENPEVIKCDKS